MSVFVHDSCTEGSDTAYASHSPEIGGPIVLHPFYSPAATVDAATDRVYATGTTAYYYTALPPTPDYSLEGLYFAASIIAVNTALALRISLLADTMLLLRLNNGTVWEVIQRIATSNTVLKTSTVSLPTAGNFTKVKVTVRGPFVSVELNDVREVSLDAITTILDAGRVGMRASGASSATTGFHLDDVIATTRSSGVGANALRPAIFTPGHPR